ncbi:ROK family protein [Streptomyces sp. NPDC051322]|uniref:ROK family protein n=1 Tax=Streptomyces sp. NPDC051322 TaxID=3154645 RepID=UPI00344E1BEC
MADLVGELTRRELVTESAAQRAASSRGRPSHTVAPDGARAHVLAVSLGLEGIRVASVGLGGVVTAETVLDHVPEPGDPGPTIDQLAQAMRPHVSTQAPPLAVGVSVPGLVGHVPGVASYVPHLDWHDVKLVDELQRRLPLDAPVRLGNTCNAAALAELMYGAGQGHPDLLYLYAGVGVGAGAVVDGRLLGGPGWTGGEVGHMVFGTGGRPCRCGSSGCWETEVGADALLRRAGRNPVGGPAGKAALAELVERAERGEQEAVAAVVALAPAVSTGLSSLQALLSTDVIVLDGLFSLVLRHTRHTLEEALGQRRRRLGIQRGVTLLPAALRGRAPLLGAGEIAVETFLESLAPAAPQRQSSSSGRTSSPEREAR